MVSRGISGSGDIPSHRKKDKEDAPEGHEVKGKEHEVFCNRGVGRLWHRKAATITAEGANALVEPRLRFKMFITSLKNRRTFAFRLDFAKPLPIVQFHVPIFAQ